MNIIICECCNYKTNNKRHYEQHLKSNKHLKNEKKKNTEIPIKETSEETDEIIETEEEANARIMSVIYPKPEFNKERTLNHIEDEGRQLLYMETGVKEGDNEEMIIEHLVRTYYERKYDVDSFKNIYKNDSLLKLSMLIYAYKNYLEITKKYEELKNVADGMFEEYRMVILENELFRMKLKQASEEIAQLKASRNQSE
jgi:hypothetical protein